MAEREARARALERLHTMLAAEDPTRRAAALMALAELGDVGLLPRIAELVADPDPRVRDAALEALRRLRQQQQERRDPPTESDRPEEPPVPDRDGG